MRLRQQTMLVLALPAISRELTQLYVMSRAGRDTFFSTSDTDTQTADFRQYLKKIYFRHFLATRKKIYFQGQNLRKTHFLNVNLKEVKS